MSDQIYVLDERTRDVAAVLIAHPHHREAMLEHLCKIGADAATVALITSRVLEWMDEFLLDRSNDGIWIDIVTRAEVAIATTPEGLETLGES
mgnify:CR=1 FL=1|tara:strand:- start:234 stop:509 length:276 start_codon:yes stop_codon:yes gene_type:complete